MSLWATICDVYFRHWYYAWVGLWGPRDILWRFQNVMDQAICDAQYMTAFEIVIEIVLWWFFSALWRNLFVIDQQIFCSVGIIAELHIDCKRRSSTSGALPALWLGRRNSPAHPHYLCLCKTVLVYHPAAPKLDKFNTLQECFICWLVEKSWEETTEKAQEGI